MKCLLAIALLPLLANCATVPHRHYATGLNMTRDWRSKVTFYDPGALGQALKFPPSVDLRKAARHGMTPIKDQGDCGDCYIFGSIAALEGTIAIEKNKTQSLSEEEVLSCNQNYNCGGGYFDIMDYFVKYGVTDQATFPYRGKPVRCPSPLPQAAGTARQWLFVGNTDQEAPSDDQLRYVLQYKPVTVTVSADQRFMDYQGGIFDGKHGLGTNHMVALVGYSSDAGGLFYILRNSWGTGWGENGYMRIRPRANNLAEAAAFVRIK